MLYKKALDDVMDKFQVFSSLNIKNIIVSFRSIEVRGREINCLFAMKKQAKIKFIDNNVFMGQGQKKVYLFKMFFNVSKRGGEIVRRMQSKGDLSKYWLKLDHVKYVKG